MEPKGSGETLTDELQDTSLQDPAVRISAWLKSRGIAWPESKVVIHKAGSQLPGTLLPDQTFKDWKDPDGVNIRIHDRNTKAVKEVALSDAKAIFFVRSFLEHAKHEDLHFYDSQAETSYLWTRITFLDGHVIECLVPNTGEMILSAAFFACSVDPEANNLAVYIVKNKVRHIQVLGLRRLSTKGVNSGATHSL
jgi:hypothetical protein